MIHGRRGCWQNKRAYAFQDQEQPEHHKQIWNVLDTTCRHGLASPTERGGMKLQLERRWREGVVDALDRLTAKHRCIKRRRCTSWTLPCPGCGASGFSVMMVV